MTETRWIGPEMYRIYNGQTASRNQIIAENHDNVTQVDQLIERGITIGQFDLWGDIVVFPINYNDYKGKEATFVLEYVLFEQ